MAETVALAVLENLVHMTKQDFPRGYVVVTAAIPENLRILTEDDLRDRFGHLDATRLGDRWFDSSVSAVLRVESAIVPGEFNYLINPRHREFSRIMVEPPVPFAFDPRLF